MAAPCSTGVFCKGECNFSKLYPLERTEVRLFGCNKPITSHLKRVGLKCGIRKDFSAEISSEGLLICLRMGHFIFDGNLTVCPSHREKMGIHWRQPLTCQHPDHSGKMKPFSAVNINMSKSLMCDQGVLVPVGVECFKGRNRKTEDVTSDHVSHMEDDTKGKFLTQDKQPSSRQASSRQTSHYYCDFSDTDSQTLQLSQHSNWSEISENILQEKSLDDIHICFSLISNEKMSPLRSLTSDWDSVSGRTQRYYKRKADEAVEHVLELIAPGQTNCLRQTQINSALHHCEDDMIQTVSKLYLNTDSNILRSQLLSVLANRFFKHELDQYLPDLTTYKYYLAKKNIS